MSSRSQRVDQPLRLGCLEANMNRSASSAYFLDIKSSMTFYAERTMQLTRQP